MMTGLTDAGSKRRQTVAAYGELLLAFQPRTIHTEHEYAQVQAEIDRLVDKDQLSLERDLS